VGRFVLDVWRGPPRRRGRRSAALARRCPTARHRTRRVAESSRGPDPADSASLVFEDLDTALGTILQAADRPAPGQWASV